MVFLLRMTISKNIYQKLNTTVRLLPYVIGDRYGSVDENGISFTEKTYEVALSISLPVFA